MDFLSICWHVELDFLLDRYVWIYFFSVCLLPGYYMILSNSAVQFDLFGILTFNMKKSSKLPKVPPSVCWFITEQQGFSKGWQESNGSGNSWHSLPGRWCVGIGVKINKHSTSWRILKMIIYIPYCISKKSFLLKQLMELHCYVLFPGGNQCDQSSS